MLEFILFGLFVAAGAYALHERNGRITAENKLSVEMGMSETLGQTLAQLRTRLETTERALADLGGPAPRSTIRRTVQ